MTRRGKDSAQRFSAPQRFGPIEWIVETGSTNADLLERAAAGEAAGAVRVAEHQVAGRGRQGRTWVDDPGRSLLFSILLRPPADAATLVPLATGLAVRDAIGDLTGLEVGLKWPNDVLVPSADERKLAGILTEATTGGAGLAVVPGCGINLAFGDSPKPVEVTSRAVDLASLGHDLDRVALLEAILGHLDGHLTRFEAADLTTTLERYRAACLSIGRQIRLSVPTGETAGTVVGIDADGALLLDTGAEVERILAGDAHHLAPGT